MFREFLNGLKGGVKVKSEKLDSFFVGQTVSIAPAYYKEANDSPVKTPVYGWTIKAIAGNYVTLLSGDGQKKAFVEIKHLQRG
jgi:hypothetical protein